MTPSKRCSKCLTEKPISDFYKTPSNRDGHFGRCKTCVIAQQTAWNKTEDGKASMAKFREENPTYFKEYQKAYGVSEKGIAIRREYRQTDKWKANKKAYLLRRYGGEEGLRKARRAQLKAAETPEKINAWRKSDRAVRSGKLKRQPCACGNPKAEKHHEDYSKPLDVIWLCARCHGKLHHQKRLLLDIDNY